VKLSNMEATVALSILKARRAEYAAYDEVVADYRRQGHRPARCIHGRYLWGDNDIPCGYCEEGEGTYDYQRVASEAIADAKMLVKEHRHRRAAYEAVYAVDPGYAGLGDLLVWACEPVMPREGK
jgi:hypothetical protein